MRYPKSFRRQTIRDLSRYGDFSREDIIDKIVPIISRPSDWPTAESLPDVSEHQREQYAKATQGHICILGGRPGTGKTFTLARVLNCIPPYQVAVAAPTGKAAVRLSESLSLAKVEGIRASTIHSLLKVTSSKGQWRFEHWEENPLPHNYIVIDEPSMIPTGLMGSLLAARKPGCRVLMAGDVNQLAPVEHGAPLRDLREILPYGELVKIQRNSGRIVKACHDIIDRETYVPSEKIDLAAEFPENMLHVERREPAEQIDCLKKMLEAFRMGKQICCRKDGELISQNVNPVWDCQIVVPVNEKSDVSRKPLNSILQGFLNPGGQQVKGYTFRVGDKIVCGKNGFLKVETGRTPDQMNIHFNAEECEGKVYVANGELAVVLALLQNYAVARLWLPDRLVRIPRAALVREEESENEEAFSWDLAYALSLHKMQGSEAPVVITVADSYPGARRLCDRSWIYTALSRAKVFGITVGMIDVIQDMCKKSHIWNRKTFLRESIADLKNHAQSMEWASELEGL